MDHYKDYCCGLCDRGGYCGRSRTKWMNRPARTKTIVLVAFMIVFVVYAIARAQEPDAPSKPGDCAVYFIARDKHSNTYQLTCSDPQPDAITIEHAATDSQKVYTARTH